MDSKTMAAVANSDKVKDDLNEKVIDGKMVAQLVKDELTAAVGAEIGRASCRERV